MGKLSTKALLIIATILSLLAAFLVYQYLARQTGSTSKASAVVVVAKVEIPPKTKISADMVQQMAMPPEYVQPGGIASVNDVVGVTTSERIIPGEQLTERRLLIAGKSGVFTTAIPSDKRAVSVGISEVSGVAGFVKPGDFVDIVVTFEKSVIGDNASQLLLQNIQVLAVNREAENGVTNSSSKEATKDNVKLAATVTLAVTPEETAQLTIAEDKGKIRLALRPYVPKQNSIIPTPAVPSDLVKVAARQPEPTAEKPTAAPEKPTPVQPSAAKTVMVIRGTKVE